MADLKSMKGVSEKDRKLIEEAEDLLGPEPSIPWAFVKNLFWGRFREDLYVARIPRSEHRRNGAVRPARRRTGPTTSRTSTRLDRDRPRAGDPATGSWTSGSSGSGVLGMTIPQAISAGGGYGITSYNRVLETIGQATAVRRR